jgi:hypothetical protein
MGPENFDDVTKLIRLARHATINAMRAELGLKGRADPEIDYNPFKGTPLEEKYAKGQGKRPRPEAVT